MPCGPYLYQFCIFYLPSWEQYTEIERMVPAVGLNDENKSIKSLALIFIQSQLQSANLLVTWTCYPFTTFSSESDQTPSDSQTNQSSQSSIQLQDCSLYYFIHFDMLFQCCYYDYSSLQLSLSSSSSSIRGTTFFFFYLIFLLFTFKFCFADTSLSYLSLFSQVQQQSSMAPSPSSACTFLPYLSTEAVILKFQLFILLANLWSILILAMLSFGATNFGSYSADLNLQSFVACSFYFLVEGLFDYFVYFCISFVFVVF